MSRSFVEHFIGSLVGGAVGDALGAPVEFMSLSEIRERFGSEGICRYAPAYGRLGAITDDTQMTLFTAEGLILSRVRSAGGEPNDLRTFVYEAYLRWLATQNEVDDRRLIAQYGTCVVLDGILSGYRQLHSRRAPGNACLSALSSCVMGTVEAPINNSKGCGGVMRIAPVGLFVSPDDVFDHGCDIAAITHGHPSGYLAAGCMAQIIHLLVTGVGLEDAIGQATRSLAARADSEECLKAVTRAVDTWRRAPVSFETVETLGRGWVAEEALAIAIYCALAAGGNFEKGVCLAVNHGGDSDSTGAITGNILGALLGIGAIPTEFTQPLELLDLIEELATDLYRFS